MLTPKQGKTEHGKVAKYRVSEPKGDKQGIHMEAEPTTGYLRLRRVHKGRWPGTEYRSPSKNISTKAWPGMGNLCLVRWVSM